jgi:hypothetical protein
MSSVVKSRKRRHDIPRLTLSDWEKESGVFFSVRWLLGWPSACPQGGFVGQVHKDWPVIEIKGANHITCILKEQFREEIVAWLKKNSK